MQHPQLFPRCVATFRATRASSRRQVAPEMNCVTSNPHPGSQATSGGASPAEPARSSNAHSTPAIDAQRRRLRSTEPHEPVAPIMRGLPRVIAEPASHGLERRVRKPRVASRARSAARTVVSGEPAACAMVTSASAVMASPLPAPRPRRDRVSQTLAPLQVAAHRQHDVDEKQPRRGVESLAEIECGGARSNTTQYSQFSMIFRVIIQVATTLPQATNESA